MPALAITEPEWPLWGVYLGPAGHGLALISLVSVRGNPFSARFALPAWSYDHQHGLGLGGELFLALGEDTAV